MHTTRGSGGCFSLNSKSDASHPPCVPTSNRLGDRFCPWSLPIALSPQRATIHGQRLSALPFSTFQSFNSAFNSTIGKSSTDREVPSTQSTSTTLYLSV